MCVWIYDVGVDKHILCTYCKYVFVHTHTYTHTYIQRIKKGCLNKIVQEVESLSQVSKIFKYLKTPFSIVHEEALDKWRGKFFRHQSHCKRQKWWKMLICYESAPCL